MPLSVSRRRKEGRTRGEERGLPCATLEKLWARSSKHTDAETKSSRLFGHSYRIEISFRHTNFEMTENYGIAFKSHRYFRSIFYEGGRKIHGAFHDVILKLRWCLFDASKMKQLMLLFISIVIEKKNVSFNQKYGASISHKLWLIISLSFTCNFMHVHWKKNSW